MATAWLAMTWFVESSMMVGIGPATEAEVDAEDGDIESFNDDVAVVVAVAVAVVIVVVVVGSQSVVKLTSPRNSITNDLLPALIFKAPVKAPLVPKPGANATTIAPCGLE